MDVVDTIPPIATLNYYYFTIYIYIYLYIGTVYNVKSGESGRRVTVYRFAGKLTSGSGGDENFVSARYLYYCTYISCIYIIYTNTHHRYTPNLGYPRRKVPSLAPLSTITTTADTNRLVNFGFACAHSICTHFAITV